MAIIKSIIARQILDSRGNPTVEADVVLENNTLGRAAVPSGASTGINEAVELRDGDLKNYNGMSVIKAVHTIKTEIQPALIGKNVEDQTLIDKTLIQLDGTENKKRLGANSILAVSLAVAHAAANASHIPLYEHIQKISSEKREFILPLPMMNVINGGKHGGWAADIQEYMIFPVGASTFSHALQMGTEVFHNLASVLKDKGYPISVGDEGGFSPPLKEGNKEAFDLISQAIEKAGYKLGDDFVFGMDAAASEFYKDEKYHLNTENKLLSSAEMVDWLKDLTQKYPIVSLEDCLDQNDWDAWKVLTNQLGDNMQIVGDDLFVTNIKFLERGIAEKAANSILIKVNQIGTLTETINAVEMAHKAGWKAIVSHRSGETEDTTIAHIVVGLGTGQIKAGSLSRTDRVAKYNELLRIEEHLHTKAFFAGRKALQK